MSERDGPWVAAAVIAAWAPWLLLLARGGVPLAHDVAVSDLLHSFTAYDAAIGEALRAGRLPLWLDGPFLGSNLAGQIEAAVFYPPRWLVAVLPPWTAFDALLMVHVAVAATGGYALARRAGATPIGAALAGAVTGGGGFLVAHVKHPNLIGSAAWTPWVIAASASVGARPWPWWPVGAVAVAGAWLAGHPQIAFYASVVGVVIATGAAAGQGLARTNERSHTRIEHAAIGLRSLVWSGSMLATGAAVALIAVLPTAAYASHTLRGDLTWAFASRFPLDPLDLAWFVAPELRGCPYDGTYTVTAAETLPWENYAAVGTIPLVFAGLAPLGPRRRAALAIALAIAGAVLFALGPATPLYGAVWSVVPGFRAFRFPVRALGLAALGLGVLAALGLDALLAARADRRRVGVGIVAIAALHLAAGHRSWLGADRPAAWTGPSDVAEAVRADGGERVYMVDPTGPWGEAFRDHALSDGAAPYRETARWPILNRARVLGLWSPAGYTALLHERTAWFWILVNRDQLVGAPPLPGVVDGLLTGQRRLEKAGVTHVIADGLGLPEVRRFGDRAVYRLPEARPSAFTVGGWATAATPEAARAAAEADPGVVIEDPGPAGTGDPRPASIAVARHGPNAMSVDVSGRVGLLVIAEAWDDGWTASVDGVPTPVRVADGWLRAVRLPEGAREVRLAFWPPGLSAGLAGAAFGVVAFVLGTILASRHQSTPDRRAADQSNPTPSTHSPVTTTSSS